MKKNSLGCPRSVELGPTLGLCVLRLCVDLGGFMWVGCKDKPWVGEWQLVVVGARDLDLERLRLMMREHPCLVLLHW